jgi:hypothetical protein
MLTYVKTEPRKLRDLGLDERWLQDRVADDPSILGLGDLSIIAREKGQPAGGRIDLVLFDPVEEGVRYEVEIMLGRLDESHIIRTIEYWDVERQRYPALRHRAVIVAEDITSRFFNVIGLLNRAIPMIAIQMSAFQFEDKVVLHFAKLLDLVEAAADEEVDQVDQQRDRGYWDRRANPASMGVVDKVLALLPAAATPPRVTYNQGHIAVGGRGRNFCWLHPRQKQSHTVADVRVGDENRDAWLEKLEGAGIGAYKIESSSKHLRVPLTQRELAEHEGLIRELLAACEEQGRR